MNIQRKIEEIKNEPEHVRIRYVWGCVAVSMIFIFSIWLFSVTTMFKKGVIETPKQDSLTDLKKQIEDVNKQAPNLKDLPNALNAVEETASVAEELPDETAESNSIEIPESSAYSTEE